MPIARLFELWTAAHPADLTVVTFRGVEAVSQPYRFNILVSARGIDHERLAVDVLGQRGRLTFIDETVRHIHGVFTRVDVEGITGGDEDRHHVRIQLAPRFSLLKHRKNSRIFQNLTVLQVVSRVLDEHKIPHLHKVQRSYQPRTYCVQYEETDFAFIERVLAEEGIYYFFEHSDSEVGTETLVTHDTAGFSPDIAPPALLRYRDSGGMAETNSDIRSLRVEERIRSGRIEITDYDFTRPSADLRAQADNIGSPNGFAQNTLETYEHQALGHPELPTKVRADSDLGQLRTRAVVVRGKSACRRLAAGHRFAVFGAPLQLQNRPFVLTRIVHEGKQPHAMRSSAALGNDGGEIYSNRFEATFAEHAPRPERPRRRFVQVMETATVVGPAGHEIHTDEHGRIKVQFHWDREGRRNEHSSCWIRAVQSWAGSGWGSQFIPRIGMEVAVTFIGGDVDHPVVSGCLPNMEHPVPFGLPRNKTVSGIRTQSSKGGNGYNELSFEDRKGYERIYLRAERDKEEMVRHNQRALIGNEKILQVGGNSSEVVGNRKTLFVGEEFVRMSGSSETRTTGQDHYGTTARHDVLHVGGSRMAAIAENDELQVGQHRQTRIGGRASLHVGGDLAVAAAAGVFFDTTSVEAKIGVEGMKLNCGGDAQLNIGGDFSIAVGGSFKLLCGDTTIEIKDGNVAIVTKKLTVKAVDGISLVSSGASVSLTDSAVITSANVNLNGQSAALSLGSTAELKGSQVKLGSGGGDSASESSSAESAPPTEQTLTFQLSAGRGTWVIRDTEGTEISRTESSGDEERLRSFEVDPKEHDKPVEIFYEDQASIIHLAGPVLLSEFAAHLAHGNVKRASELSPMKRSQPRPASADDTSAAGDQQGAASDSENDPALAHEDADHNEAEAGPPPPPLHEDPQGGGPLPIPSYWCDWLPTRPNDL